MARHSTVPMTSTTTPPTSPSLEPAAQPLPPEAGGAPLPARTTGRHRRVPISLIVLLAATALLYLWDLGASGYANSFYSAAAQAGSESWKAFFFGSSDAGNAITVDKPPAALWIMALSVRIFGLSSWSILVPEALLGVASVGVLYATVRRVLGHGGQDRARAHWAALAGAAVFALTPVATLMFRFNNPDALLVLLLMLAAWCTVRASERASGRWLVGAGVLIGFGFLTKMLQAFLVLPALAVAYLVAAPATWRRKLGHLVAAFAAMLVSLGWYVAIVELVPASWRPYIGGSQNNSLLELIFGYNGLGRITGNETGSVTGGGGFAGGSMWGQTGVLRMFAGVSGGMVAWLIPAALILAVCALIATARAPLAERTASSRIPVIATVAGMQRAGLIVFAGWLVVTALVFSFMAGIYHDYYTVALAPAIGGTVAIGMAVLWVRRESLLARLAMAAAVAATAVWAVMLTQRATGVYPVIGWAAGIVGGLAALALLISERLPRFVARAVLALAVLAGLVGPAAYSINTAATPHQGSIVTAGPVSGGMGFGRAGGPGGAAGQPRPDGMNAPPGAPPGMPGGARTGGMGGLLGGATVAAETRAALVQDAEHYTWVAAAVGSQTAASYQLATGYPVMAIGGFNGSDPAPTLAEFQQLVQQGRIHYFLGGGMGGRQNGGSSAAQEIQTWVSENFRSQTIGGATVYDLTTPIG